MGITLRIPTAEVFEPLLEPARYKGGHGGRGSGKSHIFADLAVEMCQAEKGNQVVCIREVQKTLAQSSKRLIETKIQALGVGQGFKVFHDKIVTPGDGIVIFQGMQDSTAESIKSLQGFKIAWIDEAQAFSARSLSLLRPTIRESNSEIWASWNPTRKVDAIDDFFRGPLGLPKGAVCVQANWRDNPWWNSTLEAERLLELERYPDRYEHTYEGGYAKAFEGAYFAGLLTQAKLKGRIGHVEADPLLPIRAFIDIGGSGATADAFVIWIVQWVGQEIRVLDYYEAVGQVLGAHVAWLRKNGYEAAILYLPHDGVNENNVTGKRYETHLRDAGFKVEPPIKNQGKGAAAMRIEAVRRLGPKMWFNEKTTEPGRDALGFYHERKDEVRNIGLGPDHDWSSHGCFHGETELVTRYGMCRIMNLPENGEVLTPCGWKQYILPRITKRNAPLVEVVFTDGYSVKCTPDHLFLTVNGWKSAGSLTRDMLIQSSLTQGHNTSTVVSIAFGRANHILRTAVADCIARLGSPLSGKFRADATFTTGTITLETIALKILSACPPRSTYLSAGKTASLPLDPTSISPRQQEARRTIGTGQKPVEFGTVAWQSELKDGLNGSASPANVRSAIRRLMRSFENPGILKFIARQIVKLQHIAVESFKTYGPLRIEHVKRLNETADVWDITVPDGHWFSLANGAVVHNSDAFGLMAVAYEEPGRAEGFGRPLVYKNQGYA